MIFSRYYRSANATNASNIVLEWIKRFQAEHIPEPKLSAKLILQHVQSKNVAGVKVDKLTSQQIRLYDKLCRMRLDRMPVQYIIGEWDFRFITLKMKPPVFIPRPETEELIELVNRYEFQKSSPDHQIVFVDIGCGSGAISLSILHENYQAKCIAIDKDPLAVQLTKLNSSRLNLNDRITIKQFEITKATSSDIARDGLAVDFIISNPPYVPTSQMETLQEEIVSYESPVALDGGHDGLDTIKQILCCAPMYLRDGGRIWLEVDSSHPSMIKSYLNSHNRFRWKFIYEDTFCDFSRRDFVDYDFKKIVHKMDVRTALLSYTKEDGIVNKFPLFVRQHWQQQFYNNAA